MRPSPLQLKHVIYTKVSVLPGPTGKDAKGVDIPKRAFGFDFEGVGIRATVGSARREGQDEDPRDFLVNLEVVIDNKEGKPTPYAIDVGVVGVFNVLPTLAKEKRQDLVAVNGASILYGVIREIVLLLTSRFSAGGLTLPGMNFEDIASTNRTNESSEATPVAAKSVPTKGTRRASKKR